MLGESIGRDIRIGHRLREVGFAERDHVFVRRKQMTALQRLHAVGGLARQRVFHFLADDCAAEHPGKYIADGDFELALDSLHNAHVTVLPFLCRFPYR